MMPKLLVCGRGGSGKSTLVALLAQCLGEEGKVLVVDADESNLGLGTMLRLQPSWGSRSTSRWRKTTAALSS
jgi:CO dehydrogenase maturation factor